MAENEYYLLQESLLKLSHHNRLLLISKFLIMQTTQTYYYRFDHSTKKGHNLKSLLESVLNSSIKTEYLINHILENGKECHIYALIRSYFVGLMNCKPFKTHVYALFLIDTLQRRDMMKKVLFIVSLYSIISFY